MDTRDLSSYYPGYDDYSDGRVSYDDYAELEEVIEKYDRAVDEIEEILFDEEQYTINDKLETFKEIIKDLRRELEKC